jgi:hypothetical protein
MSIKRVVYRGLIGLVVVASLLLLGHAPVLASVYSDVILADNPYAFYRFDNDTGAPGSVLDDSSSGGTNDGDYVGTVAIEPDTPLASGGLASHYPGNVNYYARGTSSQPTTAVTVEAWAKSDTVNWNNTGMIVSKRNGFIIHPNSGGKSLRFYVHSGGWTPVEFNLASIPGFDIRDWHQYVGVYDSTLANNQLKLYVDGVLRAQTNKTGNITNQGNPTYIGQDSLCCGGNRRFDGLIDEVALYSTALSDDRILAHFNAAAIVPEPSTLLIWSLLAGLGIGVGWWRRKG